MTNIVDAVRNESLHAKNSERLLGSSEIIESLFGKQKYIEKQQSKSGFTGLILSAAALVSTTTKSVIQKAMESTKTKTVVEWCNKNIGKSVHAKRVDAFQFLASGAIQNTFKDHLLKSVDVIGNNDINNTVSVETISSLYLSNKSEQKMSQFLLGDKG